MEKTAIENKQNLIIEGCYIPFDWSKGFEKDDLEHIKFYCLVMSGNYIKNNFASIKKYARDVWATGQVDLTKWNQSFQEHFSFVAMMCWMSSYVFWIGIIFRSIKIQQTVQNSYFSG